MTEGVDYAWDRPSVAGLVAAGKKFACRYGGPGSVGKQLSMSEADDLRAAGIAIVANAEGRADGMKGGYSMGRAWAIDALAHFRACGMPVRRPVYLSVDFDADSSHWAAIDAALRGAADYLGAAQVGVYGGYDTIAHCVSADTARWFWQTYAWSSGRWHPRAHIRQYRNHVSLAGGTVDLNRAMTVDYGQWGIVEEEPVAYMDDRDARVQAYRVKAIIDGSDPVRTNVAADPVQPNMLWQRLDAMADDLAELAARPPVTLDPAALGAILAASPQFVDAVSTAVAARVGMIPTAQEIARAVGELSWHGRVS